MKLIDRILRKWRVEVALKALPENVTSVFDIGCDDGYLLRKIPGNALRLDGCDPRLAVQSSSQKSTLLKGFFPGVLSDAKLLGKYDAIFALAVFEHFTEEDLVQSSKVIAELLNDDGRLIVTVPHPFVDKILDFLLACKLIDGQALDEHHGFDPKSLVGLLSSSLRVKYRGTFQLGLNNLIVFVKI